MNREIKDYIERLHEIKRFILDYPVDDLVGGKQFLVYGLPYGDRDKMINSTEYIMNFLSCLSNYYVKKANKSATGNWTNTDETVWEAKDKDGKQELEISIVSAKCSVCKRWAEQVNQMPPYMHYEYCPHCGVKMEE